MKRFPSAPPVVYVTPTSNMSIRVGPHVDSNGVVYLPYLHDWTAQVRLIARTRVAQRTGSAGRLHCRGWG